MSCKTMTELATEHLDDALPWWEKVRVRLHLGMCSACRCYVGQIEQTAIALRAQATDEKPSPEVKARLLSHLVSRTRP